MAMQTLMESCIIDFSQQDTGASLSKLKIEYEVLSAEELHEDSEDQYFSGLLHTVNTIMTQLRIREEL